MAFENQKLFKGILQYTAEQFKSVTKEAGFIYFVRDMKGSEPTGDAQVWFGTRLYANVGASDLAALEARIKTLEDHNLDTRLDAVEAALGTWEESLGTVAAVVKGHNDKLAGVDTTVVASIEAAVSAETAAREEADEALQEQIDALSGVSHSHENKAELDKIVDGDVAGWRQAKEDIDAFLSDNDVTSGVVDTLKEIQEYISSDGAAADKMVKDIAANASAITQEVADRKAAVSAETAAREAAVTGLNKTISDMEAAYKAADAALEAKITAETAAREEADANLQTAITKEVADREAAVSGLQETISEMDEAYKAADADLLGKIGALEGKVGDDSLAAVRTLAQQGVDDAATAQAAADAAQGEVDALEGLVGEGFTEDKTVASEIARVEGLVNAIDHRVYYGGGDAE